MRILSLSVIVLSLVLFSSTLPAVTTSAYAADASEYIIDTVSLEALKGSASIESKEGYSYDINWDLNIRYDLYDLYESKLIEDKLGLQPVVEKGLVSYTNTSNKPAPALGFRALPIFKVVKDPPKRYQINIGGDNRYEFISGYYKETKSGVNYSDISTIKGFNPADGISIGMGDSIAPGETYDIELSGATTTMTMVSKEAHKTVLSDIYDWVILVWLAEDGRYRYFDPVDPSSYGHYEDEDGDESILLTMSSTSSTNDKGAQSPSGDSSNGEGDEKKTQLDYTPSYSDKSIKLEATGDLDKLFTTRSYESMKLYCMVEAAQEMAARSGSYESYMRDFFGKLGFTSCEPFRTGEDLFGNDATGWFAHKVMADGRNLVFTFVQGTENLQQWVGNFSAYGMLTGNHYGLYTAAEKVAGALVLFADKCGADPNNTAFSFDGYSHGAGVVDALSSQPTIPGTSVALNESNCLAYTFEAPNTVGTQPDQKTPYVINVVDANDVVPFLPPGWHKNGTVLGYGHSPETIKTFYGVAEIDDPALIGGHFADNVIASVFSREPTSEWDKVEFDHTTVHCLTNVKVVKDNALVASVINNVATFSDDALIFTNEDGEKDAITPHGEGYRVIVEATGNDTANIAVNQLGGDTQQKPEAFEIKDKVSYEVDLNSGQLVELDEPLTLTDEQPSKIKFWLIPLSVALILVSIFFLVTARRGRHSKTSNFR
jgi:hypothetical protein